MPKHPLKKRRAVFPEEDFVIDESDGEMEQDEMIGETIDVEFEGFQPEDSDFHGIRRLLSQLFGPFLSVDISGITDIILGQNYVGSVIKQVFDDEDDSDSDNELDRDEVFGITTVINLTSRKDEAAISGLRSALVASVTTNGSDSTARQLRDILGNDARHTGLLLSERLVNLPAQISLPVFDSLRKEMDDAKAKQMPYDFNHVVMVCKLCKTKKKTKNKDGREKEEEEITWSNPEEEIFAEECEASWEVKADNSAGGGGWSEDDPQVHPYRRVLILQAAKVPSIMAKVQQALQEQQQ